MQFAIDSVAPLNDGTAADASLRGVSTGVEPGAFAKVMERELGDLNTHVVSAENAVRDLASGKPVELHEVMISLERARLSVQAFVQIRNKLVESYQDLMRMQM